MKKEVLLNAFGEIDDDLIESSETTNNKVIKFPINKVRNYIAVAACFILIIVGSFTIPNMLTPQPPDDVGYSDFRMRHTFVGTIERLENDNGIMLAYIIPNEDEALAKYDKLAIVALSDTHDVEIGETVTVHYSEVANTDEYIEFLSALVEDLQ